MSFKDEPKFAIIDSSNTWYAQPKQIYNELIGMGYECLWLARPNHEGSRSNSVPPGYITICIANNVSPIDFITRLPLTLAHPPLERAYKSEADFVFVGDKLTFLTYFSHRPNAFYMPYAVNADIYKPIAEVDEVYDVGFVGNIRIEERKRRIELIRNHFHCFVGQKLFMEKANKSLNSCKIIFNTSDAKEINMRVFEALATGKLLITDKVEYLDELFEDGVHLVTYSNESEIIEKISYYLENENKRKEIARNGSETVRKYHTYRCRAEFMIEKIKHSDYLTRPMERKHLPSSFTYRKFYEKQSETNRLAQERLFDPSIPDLDSGGMFNVRERLKEALKVAKGKILDIGCQRGGYCSHLQGAGLDVVGIDIRSGYLKMAKRKVLDACFALADAQFLPFKEESFDTVILSEVLEHVIDEKRVVSEVARVLRPEGVVFVTVPAYQDDSEEHVRVLSKRRLAELFHDFTISFQDKFNVRSTILVAYKKEKSDVLLENETRKDDKKLSILLTNHHLLDFTGSEVFTFTIADFLKRNGHDVVVYSKYIDRIRKYFDARNILIVDDLSKLKGKHFDVAHVHHNINALEVRHFLPTVPIVFLSHGVLPFLEQPPLIDIHISKLLAVSEEVQDTLITRLGNNHAINVYRNIVDAGIFRPYSQIRNEPRNALILSNRIDPVTEQKIREACRQLNIRCNFIGLRFREVDYFKVPHYINRADIVFSLGRGAIEAMMCARVPIIYDYLGGDGLVTPSDFHDIMKCNFSGRTKKIDFSVDSLIKEIQKYKPQYGQELQGIACSYYGAGTQIHRLIEIYRSAMKYGVAPLASENSAHLDYIISTIHETRSYMQNYLGRSAHLAPEKSVSELIPLSKQPNAGRGKNAEDELFELLPCNTDDPVSLHQYAIVLFQQGRTRDAIEKMGLALKLDPLNAEFHNDTGAMYHASGDIIRAQGCFEKALVINPEDRTALKNLTELYIEQSRFSLARQTCTRLKGLDPEDNETSNLWSVIQSLQPEADPAAAPAADSANSVLRNEHQWSNYDWPKGGDEWSTAWGSTNRLWQRTILPRIRSFLPAGHILEIAPGFGRCTQYLLADCRRLSAVDLTKKCIKACRQRFKDYTHISFFVNDGKSLDMIEDNSIDFAFSWGSLVHAERDVIQSYLQGLAAKLKPGGVGFLHHSNIGTFQDPATGKLTVENLHWRGENISAELFRTYCKDTGLRCLTQEIIAWGGSVLNDCLSVFVKENGYEPEETVILENPDFMGEAEGLRKPPDIYEHMHSYAEPRDVKGENVKETVDDDTRGRTSFHPPYTLSIILSVKNTMKATYRSIQSILPNIPRYGVELIIVDSGSHDGTRDYLSRLVRENVTIVLPEEEKTPAQGSVLGAEKASGKFLMFIDDSVVISKSWMSYIMCSLENESEWDALVGKTVSTSGFIVEAGSTSPGKAGLKSRGSGVPLSDPSYNFTCRVGSGSRHGMLVKRSVWDEMKGFDAELEHPGSALIDFGIAMTSKGYSILFQPRCILVENRVKSKHPAAGEALLPDTETLTSLRPSDLSPGVMRAVSGSASKNVLVLGIYLANTLNTVSDIVSILGRSEHHRVEQKWVALNGSPPDKKVAEVTMKMLTGRVPKFGIINELLSSEDLSHYDYVVLCDDDVVLPERFVDSFIAMQSFFGFAIAQPARTLNSYIDHPIVERHIGVHARQTRFVEIGPVVSFYRSAFEFVFPFDLTSSMGWGYENVWAREGLQRNLKMGIIDAVCVDHSLRKPVANYNWQQADSERNEYLEKHDHLPLEECFRVMNTHIISEETT